MSLYASGSNYKDGIIEYDFFYEPWTYHFFASNFDPDSYDCVRDSFIGKYRTETNPVQSKKENVQTALSSVAIIAAHFIKKFLKAGEEIRLIFMLGVGSRKEKGYKIKKKYSKLKNVDNEFETIKKILG